MSRLSIYYTGSGILVLEPTYKHIRLIDTADWGGNVILNDGLVLACDFKLKPKAVMRSNLSSAEMNLAEIFLFWKKYVTNGVLVSHISESEVSTWQIFRRFIIYISGVFTNMP